MSATATDIQLKPLAILSLLGDPANTNAATRMFRGESVLAQTVRRVRSASREPEVAVLAWDDQVEAVRRAIGDENVAFSCGPRKITAQMNAVNASLRWADGWRGGLLGVSVFDRGFDAKNVLAVLEKLSCNAALLIDSYAGVIDPAALNSIIDHASERPNLDYAFLPGTPGSGAMLLRVSALQELMRNTRLPGQLLAYHPDRPIHDPLAKEYAVPVSPRVARSLTRIALDSNRQTSRLSLLQLDDTNADDLVDQIQSTPVLDALPREVVVELNTNRATVPLYSILSATPINRAPMSLETAKKLFASLVDADDVRITFAGVGDPLLHDQFDQIVIAARRAGIKAIHVETDLLDVKPQFMDVLAQGAVDVISIHLPAVHKDTYKTMMGVDRIQDVLDQFKQLVTARSRHATGLPIIVPLFIKCEANLAEMEDWYDQWIRAVGTAVVRGPSDFGGEIPYAGVSDMLPPVRKPCRRLRSRMTVLSDGTIASCEEDVHGKQACGHIDRDGISTTWTDGMQSLRMSVGSAAVCASCRMWDRP